MINFNEGQIRNLNYLKNKILSNQDVRDFCQREGKFIYNNIYRTFLPST